MIIPLCNGWTLEQYLVVLAYLNLDAGDRATNRTDGKLLAEMHARYRGKTLGQAIAYDHADTDRENKLLDFRTHIGTCCGEYIRMFQAQLLTHHAQDGLVDNLIFQLECQRRTLAIGNILYIALATYGKSMIEKFLLYRTSLIHLGLYGNIHLLPEAGHAAHTGRMYLAHALLNLVRISVDKQLCSLAQTEVSPSTLKDMGKWQEIDDTVFLGNRHYLVVGSQGSIILSIGQHDSLAVTGSTTGIKDVSHIIHACRLIQSLHLSLSRQVLAQLDEVLEVKGSRVVSTDAHAGVEDDDTLQRRTESKDTMCLVVLILLAYKEEAHLSVGNHILYLLLAAGSIKGNRAHLDAISTKVGIEIMHAILGENSNLVMRLCTNVQQSIAHLFHSQRKLIP